MGKTVKSQVHNIPKNLIFFSDATCRLKFSYSYRFAMAVASISLFEIQTTKVWGVLFGGFGSYLLI